MCGGPPRASRTHPPGPARRTHHVTSSDAARPSVAVVGAGISGLTAAYLLRGDHDVTLFESEPRAGGHAHTHDVDLADGSPAAVDSGFIVLNDRTYPVVNRLFAELGVRTRPTEMSMSITCDGCGLSFAGGRKLPGIFAQRRRLLDPRFLRFLLDVKRFQRTALALLEGAEAGGETGLAEHPLSYGDFLSQEGFGDYFVAHYAMPVVSCVWSMGYEEARGYPAAYLFAFLRHHGFLSVSGSPTWHTVVGGSRTYVETILQRLRSDAGHGVEVANGVTAVARVDGGVEVTDGSGRTRRFDKVVLATHADTSLALLSDPTPKEKELLGAFGYSTNQTFLHRDMTTMPSVPGARAAWNYRLDTCDATTDRTRVTYWMNRLQGHPESSPLLVTLNPDDAPAEVIAEMTYEHPTYTAESVAAQARLGELGDGVTAFAGAYHGWGFHEDGARSGVAAAASLGVDW
ncbi:FAD-dependent oxidoreductase [Nocardioidaceae bacterium]|nr:FAD-dependent oxidoreductase [Nocardioidaceae bacterium]